MRGSSASASITLRTLPRDAAPAVRAAADAADRRRHQRRRRLDQAPGLALRAVADGQPVERLARRDEGLADPFDERHDRDEDRHADADAEDGEQRGGAAHEKVADVVLDRDEHHATSRSPAAIGRAAPRHAGTTALTIDIPSATATARATVGAWMLKCWIIPFVIV